MKYPWTSICNLPFSNFFFFFLIAKSQIHKGVTILFCLREYTHGNTHTHTQGKGGEREIERAWRFILSFSKEN